MLYEGVKYVLTAEPSDTTVQAGQSLSFSGTVTPAEVGHLINGVGHVVYLEKLNPATSSYHVIEVGEVGAGSTYSIVHAFFNAGTSVVRIKIPGGPANATTDSQPFTIQVTPRCRSALTPEAPGNSTQPPEGQI